ncbi:MAG: DHHW family protein [Oscillospiraceae bacterium]|nr:DHHW family protein [Oscillospiraceae bacterium]MCL2277960.1 DHHW family protein [Oscillospiraceae bacterium]
MGDNIRLNIVLSSAALIILFFFVFILPSDENASEFENRNMEQFPVLTFESYLSGEFFKRFESYLLDNTAMRTSWLTLGHIAEMSYGLRLPGGGAMVDFGGADLGIGLVPDEPDDVIPFSAFSPGLSEVQVITTGAVSEPFSVDVNFHEDAVFYLRYTENRELAARYAEVLNSYRAAVADDVRMFSLISPVKVEFMGERYRAVNSSQLGTINFIGELLDESIVQVDAHGFLEAHFEEYIFFRLDHHWTALGAYYAYLAFAEAAGIDPITIENYTEHAIEGFIGSLAVGTRNRTVLENPDTIYFYTLDDGTEFSIDMFVIPTEFSALSYRVFLGGDRAIYSFTTSNLNGRTLVVVKDSFANALIPWIAPHYEMIVVIDPRQFFGSVTQILEYLENVDLLFVNYIPATTMPDLIEQLYNAR